MNSSNIRFIDLFAGIGGIRKGFELACKERGKICECVFTSEIKPYAVDVLSQNHPGEEVFGDITKISSREIPDFDILLAGFPCQAFSAAGKRLGFEEARGTLFFDVARILKEKQPEGFILENVEGLVNHDKENPKDEIGKTLATILNILDEIGYKVSWRVLNAKDFSVPQDRKRIYIVGSKTSKPDLTSFVKKRVLVKNILETGLPTVHNDFIESLLSHYSIDELQGKSLKDKRGGDNNIHSWDIGIKGSVTDTEKKLLDKILKERRKKKWAIEYNIDWMDGMPLTFEHIESFYPLPNLKEVLDGLVQKGYIKREYPKKKVNRIRVQDHTLPLGYNIVTGKMSFPINKILDPEGFAPTLVAMDMERIYVVDGKGLRPLSLREGLRLFGYPDDYKFEIPTKLGYDLLGNTVVVPVIQAVAERLLKIIYQ